VGFSGLTRIHKTTAKGKPDITEMEIELIDDNTIKMLEIGSHITYMPKDKGTLYVGYTKYPQVPKTQEGYMRQGRDTEDGFIRFKQGLLQPSQPQVNKPKKSLPPEVLYLAVEERYVKSILKMGLIAKENKAIQLSIDTSKAQKLKENTKGKLHILKIEALDMYNDGSNFIEVRRDIWTTKTIASQYITKII